MALLGAAWGTPGAGRGAASEAGAALWHLPRAPGHRALRGWRVAMSRDPGGALWAGFRVRGSSRALVVFGPQARSAQLPSESLRMMPLEGL